jgi:aryl-alcohol dehydrogenase-like predicted oxidoreductase
MGGGGWQYSWGPQDDKESIATIIRAMELGINWIDTAAVYGLGHSEEVVGQALKQLSKKPIIATKCGLVWDKDRVISNRLKQDSIRAEVEASLKRLQAEVIDLYQIHWPAPERDIKEAWNTLAELVKEGKIRYAGVSNFNVKQIARIHKIHPVTSLQPPYNMIRREIEDELIDYCAANKIGIVVYSPMMKGLFTGKFSKERMQNLAPDDHRRNDPHFQEPELSVNLQLVEGLRSIADKHGKSISQVALAWVLRDKAITAAIVGARHPEQIEETAAAGDWRLPNGDIAAISILLRARKNALKR